MRRRGLGWIALLLLGAGASGWQLIRRDGRGAAAHGDDDDAEAAPDRLLPRGLDAAQTIEVRERGRLARFERGADGRWFRHQHAAPVPAPQASSPKRSASAIDLGAVFAHRHGSATTGDGHRHDSSPAEAARIEAALATFARTRVDRRLGPAPTGAALAPYGLLRPWLIVLVFDAAARVQLTLEVGDVAPDGLARYVIWREHATLAILPAYQIDNLMAIAAATPAASAPSRRE